MKRLIYLAACAAGVAIAASEKMPKSGFLEFRADARPFELSNAERLATEQFNQRFGACGMVIFKERKFEAWIFETRIGYAGAKGPDIVVFSTRPGSVEGLFGKKSEKRPDQAPEPTPTAITPAANARITPTADALHPRGLAK
jgi:hypothetical protein